ncbi:hypothetical protein ACHAP3_005714 [Botrytis cinerea]
MAYTFVLPCRSISHGLTDLYFNDEQVNVTGQESEYDADVETTDVEEEGTRCEIIKPITAITTATNSLVIAWKPLNTTQLGIPGAEVAQIQHAQTSLSRFGGWTPINNPPINSLQTSLTQTETSETEDTQSNTIHPSGWSVISGSQTDTSQATSVEPDKPSSYPQIWKTLHLRSHKTAISAMTNIVDAPPLKIQFRKYKKEYTSTAAQEQIKWFRYRIAYLNMGKMLDVDTEMADIKSEWGRLRERRRWLKQEMLRIKNLYTMARRRRQERMEYDLRASYDIAFIKSLREN